MITPQAETTLRILVAAFAGLDSAILAASLGVAVLALIGAPGPHGGRYLLAAIAGAVALGAALLLPAP